MASLIDGYRYKLVGRFGLASQVPSLLVAELGYDIDTKFGRFGDGTGTPPRVVTDKSTGTFSLNTLTALTLPGNIPVTGGKVDGVDISTMNTADGYLVRSGNGTFKNLVMTSIDTSVSIDNGNGVSADTTDFRVNQDWLLAFINALDLLPKRLHAAMMDNTVADADLLTDTGWGFVDVGGTHTPSGSVAWTIYTESTNGHASDNSTRYITQYARSHSTDSATNSQLYRRDRNTSGGFGAWVRKYETELEIRSLLDPVYALPARIEAEGNQNVFTDANLAIYSGWYVIPDVAGSHSPDVTKSWMLYTMTQLHGQYVFQYAYQLGNSNLDGTYLGVYTRRYVVGAPINGWTPWLRVYQSAAEIGGLFTSVDPLVTPPTPPTPLTPPSSYAHFMVYTGTGADQTFVVPTCTFIKLALWGAYSDYFSFGNGGNGFVQVEIPVTTSGGTVNVGDTLRIMVGMPGDYLINPGTWTGTLLGGYGFGGNGYNAGNTSGTISVAGSGLTGVFKPGGAIAVGDCVSGTALAIAGGVGGYGYCWNLYNALSLGANQSGSGDQSTAQGESANVSMITQGSGGLGGGGGGFKGGHCGRQTPLAQPSAGSNYLLAGGYNPVNLSGINGNLIGSGSGYGYTGRFPNSAATSITNGASSKAIIYWN